MQTDYREKGLYLLKKGQKGIVHAVFSRFGLILLLFVAQVFILFSIFQWFEEFLPHIFGGTVHVAHGRYCLLLLWWLGF